MENFDWKKEAKIQWDNSAKFWNERSQKMWDNGSRKDIIPFFHNHLEKGAKLLDIGCGDGYGTYKLQQLGYDVTGVDISEEMIAKAKDRNKEIPFLQADIVELPFDSESMDAIICINVLEWVEIPALAMKEIRRILKADGVICVGILGPTAGPRTNGYPKVFGERTICNTMMPWEFEKLAKEMKFELIDGFGVYKKGVKNTNYQGLSTELKQALSFMWVFMLRKVR